MTARRLPAVIWGGLALALGAALAAGIFSIWVRNGQPGASFGSVPDFVLVDSQGRRVGRADLLGSWWAADFIFTRCTGICPLLTTRMAEIARDVPDLALVSFSVDPLHDTPEVLARYAEQVGAEEHAGRWRFLTGPREPLYRLIGEGFRLSVSETPDAAQAEEGELITHSDRIVLVDPEGRIRGYYHGTENGAAQRLAADLARMRGR